MTRTIPQLKRIPPKLPSRCAATVLAILTLGSAFAQEGLRTLDTFSETGFTLTWNGNNGDYSSPAQAASPPPNAALNATAIGSTELNLNGLHTIAHVNDGHYGNNRSWISANGLDASVDADPWIGLMFPSPIHVQKIAWSRDNGNDAEGVYTDRATGAFTLQFTQVPSPRATTLDATDPAAGWATIGRVKIGGGIDTAALSAHLRHEFVVSRNGQPIVATGIRLKELTGKAAIDEIEIFEGITLSASIRENRSVNLEWAGGGTLFAAPSAAGPWTEITGAISPFKHTADAAQGPTFYRVGLSPWDSLPLAQYVQWLREQTETLLSGCLVPTQSGTSIYTPDGKGNYKALWTRDFAYMVENSGDLMPLESIEACIRILIAGIRNDGATPDRVQPDGISVYSAGPITNPIGEPNLDNAQFLVIAVDEYLKSLPLPNALVLFGEWFDPLEKAMDYLPLSERGLIFNDPAHPHSPYGFTDTVGKTGELWMESLLYWTACQRLARWHEAAGHTEAASRWEARARSIEDHSDVFWDDQKAAFYAATEDCHQIDVWATAYALYTHFPLGPKRDRIIDFLISNYKKYVWHGQVRHLLTPEHWQRLLLTIEPERYQNGAYWATASGWVIAALAEKDKSLAKQMFVDLIADFKAGGICECINEGYRQLPSYVVSASNPLTVGEKLFKK